MRRRRYLQTIAATLTGGLTGCSDLGVRSDGSRTDTPTQTETDTPTDTPTPTPRNEPRVAEVSLYTNLLPEPHLRGTEKTSDFTSENAVFTRIDWEWYLQMRRTVPKFGPTADENWSFLPVDGNFNRVPSADIFKTPVYNVLFTVGAVDNQMRNFENLNDTLRAQLGPSAGTDEAEAAPEIDEVMISYDPVTIYFIGIDTDAVRDALKDNVPVEEVSDVNIGIDTYFSVFPEDESKESNRVIFVSDQYERSVVAYMAENAPPRQYAPITGRLEKNEQIAPASELESMQWCLDELMDAPVVTGEVNGGTPRFDGSPHENRQIGAIEPYDTLMHAMDVSEVAGTVQAVVSSVDGTAPEEAALREAFAEDSGQYSTTYHPNVSSITATW